MKVINDVLEYNLKIYQDSDWFCFSLDSVILANFVRIPLRTKNILDLGCGNGIVSLILSCRTSASIDGVELQKDLVQLARDSVCLNHLDSQIQIHHMDMKEFSKERKYHNYYDLVVTNPPYFKNEERSTKNIDVHKVIARHEVMITLEQIVSISFSLLKEGGSLAMVHRVDRFMEILCLLRKYHLEPKYIRFVYDHLDLSPSMFYVEAMKNGNVGLKIDRPFILYDSEDIETEEYQSLRRKVM